MQWHFVPYFFVVTQGFLYLYGFHYAVHFAPTVNICDIFYMLSTRYMQGIHSVLEPALNITSAVIIHIQVFKELKWPLHQQIANLLPYIDFLDSLSAVFPEIWTSEISDNNYSFPINYSENIWTVHTLVFSCTACEINTFCHNRNVLYCLGVHINLRELNGIHVTHTHTHVCMRLYSCLWHPALWLNTFLNCRQVSVSISYAYISETSLHILPDWFCMS